MAANKRNVSVNPAVVEQDTARLEIPALPPYDELQRMTDAQLVARYTEIATAPDRAGAFRGNDATILVLLSITGSFYLDELGRRSTDRANRQMLWMTRIITVLTALSVGAAVAAIVIALM